MAPPDSGSRNGHALLELRDVHASYGPIRALHGISVAVPAGSVVALLGSNGAGKTTTLRAIAGLLPLWRGRVRLEGERLDGRSAFEVASRGVVLIPEGRGVFLGISGRDYLVVRAHA